MKNLKNRYKTRYIYFDIKIKSLHTPPLKGAAQRGDIKHACKRSTVHLQPKIGIALPDQYQPTNFRTPQYFYGFSKCNIHESTNTNKSFDANNESVTLTCVQFGDPEPAPFVQLCNNKIPELPIKARMRASKNISIRPSTAINIINYNYDQESDQKGNPSLTMKYFGESKNVIGCFTAAKIPILKKRPNTVDHRVNHFSMTSTRENDIYKRFNGLAPLK